MKSTTILKSKDIRRETHVIDASGQILGKVAVTATKYLLGKDKVLNAANLVAGDKVVITNASKVRVTGKKLTDKFYQHHTGYPGGLRTEPLEKLLVRKPTEVLRLAVWGMLPKNKLRDDRMRNLKIFAGDQNGGK